MTIANVSQGSTSDLPQALRAAQEAIQLPEVKEMLRRLSEYNSASSCRTFMTNKRANFSRFPMKLCRWNLVWKCPSIHRKKSQTSQIAFSLSDGFGVPALDTLGSVRNGSGRKPGDTERYGKHKMLKEASVVLHLLGWLH